MIIDRKNIWIYLLLFLFHILVTGFITFISNSDYLTSLHNGRGFWNITGDSSIYHREALTQLGYLSNYEWLNWFKSFAAHQNVKVISLSYWVTGFSHPLSFAFINSLTWLLSVILIYKSSELLFPHIRYLPFLIIIFFIQPSILFNSTQLLRDTFFLLGMCFFIYGWVILDKDYPRWYWFFCMIFGLILTVSMRSYLFPIFALTIIGYMFWVVFKKKWMALPFIVLLSLLALYTSGSVNSKINLENTSNNELEMQKLMLNAQSVEGFSLEGTIASVIKEQNDEVIQESLNYKSLVIFEKQRIQEKLSNRILILEEKKEILKDNFLLELDSAYQLIEKKKESTLNDFLIKNSSELDELKFQHESLLKTILSTVNINQSEVDKLNRRFLIELEEFDLIKVEGLKVINQKAIDKKKYIQEELSSLLEVELNIIKLSQDNLVAGSKLESDELKFIFKRQMEELKTKHKNQIQELKLLTKLKVKDLEAIVELAEDGNKFFLIDLLDRISKYIGNLRQNFILSTHTNSSLIDMNYQISEFNSLLSYLPRATQISFLAPFPSEWLIEGKQSGKIGSLLAGFEMILWYGILTGFFYLCFINLSSMKSLIPVFICAFATIILLGYAIPNVGAIFRMRQAFMLPFFVFGFYGLYILFNKFYVKYFQN